MWCDKLVYKKTMFTQTSITQNSGTACIDKTVQIHSKSLCFLALDFNENRKHQKRSGSSWWTFLAMTRSANAFSICTRRTQGIRLVLNSNQLLSIRLNNLFCMFKGVHIYNWQLHVSDRPEGRRIVGRWCSRLFS